MSDPFAPPAKVKRLTAQRMQETIEHAEEHAALPHEEAADPYYESYLCDQIKMMAEEMQFPEQWAAEIGVTEHRMFSWIERYPEFAEAYSVAVTKLRAAFTAELFRVAKVGSGVAIGGIYTMIAKKRFADLYGDAPPPAAAVAGPRDVTPGASQTIEGTAISDMEAEQLQAELETLRRRHSD